eukprot:scaffold3980_cov348-Prasinococcus_capsulatus_cf.AAC.3
MKSSWVSWPPRSRRFRTHVFCPSAVEGAVGVLAVYLRPCPLHLGDWLLLYQVVASRAAGAGGSQINIGRLDSPDALDSFSPGPGGGSAACVGSAAVLAMRTLSRRCKPGSGGMTVGMWNDVEQGQQMSGRHGLASGSSRSPTWCP